MESAYCAERCAHPKTSNLILPKSSHQFYRVWHPPRGECRVGISHPLGRISKLVFSMKARVRLWNVIWKHLVFEFFPKPCTVFFACASYVLLFEKIGSNFHRGEGGGVLPVVACLKSFRSTTHPCRDGAPFLLLMEAPPTVGRPLRFFFEKFTYQIGSLCSSYPVPVSPSMATIYLLG